MKCPLLTFIVILYIQHRLHSNIHLFYQFRVSHWYLHKSYNCMDMIMKRVLKNCIHFIFHIFFQDCSIRVYRIVYFYLQQATCVFNNPSFRFIELELYQTGVFLYFVGQYWHWFIYWWNGQDGVSDWHKVHVPNAQTSMVEIYYYSYKYQVSGK